MLDNVAMREYLGKHIREDRMREAEQYRLVKSAEAARRSVPRQGLLASIRQALAVRRTFVRPTIATG